MTSSRRALATLAVAGLAASLSACSFGQRIANVGTEPKMSPIEDPTERRNYQPVSLPMPRPDVAIRQANSLWRPGARQFFKDQRAARIGDILTVNVKIADKAKVNNTTTRSRDNSEGASIPNFLGFETSKIPKWFPGIDVENAVGVSSTSGSTGVGKVTRDETIDLKVAAVITQVLPNGNLVITGSQEVRVNFEVRQLSITGVVRPEDITATNSINHTQIAEARIAYGGRGHLTDVQQPRYGQQIFDIIFPF
ncbi:flagellar basal body L-ring protein FlgH [Desertibaculum subflavum]|uniref:flagellar basal body L-ring protein FlgH n=1 Tax=Desertibaculum subflavum TaxID=2268458 RepID=UPI000E672C32